MPPTRTRRIGFADAHNKWVPRWESWLHPVNVKWISKIRCDVNFWLQCEHANAPFTMIPTCSSVPSPACITDGHLHMAQSAN